MTSDSSRSLFQNHDTLCIVASRKSCGFTGFLMSLIINVPQLRDYYYLRCRLLLAVAPQVLRLPLLLVQASMRLYSSRDTHARIRSLYKLALSLRDLRSVHESRRDLVQ